MSCIRCGFLYCECELIKRGVKKLGPWVERLSRTEQILLEMFETWVDGRRQEDTEEENGETKPDPAPRIALQFFRDQRSVSLELLELMAKWAREYGYEI